MGETDRDGQGDRERESVCVCVLWVGVWVCVCSWGCGPGAISDGRKELSARTAQYSTQHSTAQHFCVRCCAVIRQGNVLWLEGFEGVNRHDGMYQVDMSAVTSGRKTTNLQVGKCSVLVQIKESKALSVPLVSTQTYSLRAQKLLPFHQRQ